MYDRLFDVLYEEYINDTLITTQSITNKTKGIIERKIPELYIDPNNGFYDDTDRWNSVIDYKGKKLRHRVEAIVLGHDNTIFAYIDNDKQIKIPGGGTDKTTSKLNQVINEIHEETRLEIIDVKPLGIKYIRMIPFNSYDGSYTEVYIAKYVGKYSEDIDKVDEEKEITKYGKFYDIEDLVQNGTSYTINKYYNEYFTNK